MNKSKLLRLTCACLMVLLLAGVSCGQQKTLSLTESDRAAIYAAAIRQVYTVDHTFGVGNRHDFPVVYLPTTADDRAGDPRATDVSPEVLPKSLQTAIVSALLDLPAKFEWVDSWSDAPMDKDMVTGGGAIIYFGTIRQQVEGLVHVPAGIFFASTGGGGQTYVVELQNGVWTVTGKTGTVWES